VKEIEFSLVPDYDYKEKSFVKKMQTQLH